ncbi:MAG: hypothetical protein HKN15_00350, partial [Xanthomonadales bacterium]|nr:hypothetical protein [Xanthomonadales bacterium]
MTNVYKPALFTLFKWTCTATIFLSPGWMAAFAQENSGSEAYEDIFVEEVVVTGTRIQRRDFSSPSPLTTIDREDIEFSGQPTL